MSKLYKSGRSQTVADAGRSSPRATASGTRRPSRSSLRTWRPRSAPWWTSGRTRMPRRARRPTSSCVTHSNGRPARSAAALNQKTWADLRSRHPSNKAVSDLIHSANKWIKESHPETHKALHDSEGLGAPSLRAQADRPLYRARDKQDRAARSSKRMTPARTAVSGDIASTALANLGRSGLTENDAA